MKKVVLNWVLLMFLVAGTSVNAQLFIGPKGGVNFSKVNFQNKDNYDLYSSQPIIGFSVGLASTISVKDNFSIQSELLFSQKGKKIKGKQDPYLTHKATYNYIDVPVLFRLDFDAKIKKKDFKWFLNAGPVVSYWLGGSGKLQTGELFWEANIEWAPYDITFDQGIVQEGIVDVTDPNRFQLGLNFGTGIIVEPSQDQMIIIDARVEVGHTNFSKQSQASLPYPVYDYNDDMQSANIGLRLTAAYLFNFTIGEAKKGKSTKDKKK